MLMHCVHLWRFNCDFLDKQNPNLGSPPGHNLLWMFIGFWLAFTSWIYMFIFCLMVVIGSSPFLCHHNLPLVQFIHDMSYSHFLTPSPGFIHDLFMFILFTSSASSVHGRCHWFMQSHFPLVHTKV